MPRISGECSICQDTFENTKSDVSVTPCGHIFHATCLRTWTRSMQNATCPQCRFTFPQRSIVAKLYFNSVGDENQRKEQLQYTIDEMNDEIDHLLAEKHHLAEKMNIAYAKHKQNKEIIGGLRLELESLKRLLSDSQETIRELNVKCMYSEQFIRILKDANNNTLRQANQKMGDLRSEHESALRKAGERLNYMENACTEAVRKAMVDLKEQYDQAISEGNIEMNNIIIENEKALLKAESEMNDMKSANEQSLRKASKTISNLRNKNEWLLHQAAAKINELWTVNQGLLQERKQNTEMSRVGMNSEVSSLHRSALTKSLHSAQQSRQNLKVISDKLRNIIEHNNHEIKDIQKQLEKIKS